MKKLLYSLVAMAVIVSACNNASKTDTAGATAGNAVDAPIMKFDKDTHDFGKIKTGDKVTYDFKFKNIGRSPLIITDARATCGCTKPDWPHTPVKPGESGNIHVVFSSEGKQGLQDKMITVTANTNPADNMVHLIGEVLPAK